MTWGANRSRSPGLAILRIHLIPQPWGAGVCQREPWVGGTEVYDTARGHLHPRKRSRGGSQRPVLRAGGGWAAVGSLLRNRNQGLISSAADERRLPELQPLTQLSRYLGSTSSSPGPHLIPGTNEEKSVRPKAVVGEKLIRGRRKGGGGEGARRAGLNPTALRHPGWILPCAGFSKDLPGSSR